MNPQKTSFLVAALAAVLVLNGCASLKTAVHKTWLNEPSHRIAVLPFKGDAGYSELLAEHLVTELVDNGFVVLERSELAKIIGEHRFQYTGAVDPMTLIDSGKLSGVDFFVLGSVSTREVVPPIEWLFGTGSKVRQVDSVHVRWVNVRNGQVVASSRFRNARGGRLENIARRIVDSVAVAVESMGGARPVESARAPVEPRRHASASFRGLN